MLLPDNVHPEQSIYYNGAFVLQAIQHQTEQNLVDLYLNTITYKEMSMPIFVLCLDWLYLLSLIKLGEDGRIYLCS